MYTDRTGGESSQNHLPCSCFTHEWYLSVEVFWDFCFTITSSNKSTAAGGFQNDHTWSVFGISSQNRSTHSLHVMKYNVTLGETGESV